MSTRNEKDSYKALAKAEKVVRIVTTLSNSNHKLEKVEKSVSFKKEKHGSDSRLEKQKTNLTDKDSEKGDQPVISVTITEKKFDRKYSQEKLRKSEQPSKFLKTSPNAMTPLAQSLAGKLKDLHVIEQHEKVKVDQEIKSRMTKAINKAKMIETLTHKKFNEREKTEEIAPKISISHADGKQSKVGLKTGRKSPSRSGSISPSPQRARKSGKFLAPPSPAKGGKSGKGSSKSRGGKVKDESSKQDTVDEGDENEEKKEEPKVDWRKMNPGE